MCKDALSPVPPRGCEGERKPAGIAGGVGGDAGKVMLTPENIVVYPSSTPCLHSDGYTPYFRNLPSKNNTQLYFSVVYRLRLAHSL